MIEQSFTPFFSDISAIVDFIKKQSDKYGIDHRVIVAIILQESNFRIWATRYEPNFYRKYLANKEKKDLNGHVPTGITLNTEKVHRSTSWGLMQIMGETARGNDYVGDLPALCIPERNIEVGCRFVAHLYKWDAHLNFEQVKESSFFKKFFIANPSLEDNKDTRTLMALLRYNGGGALNYPHEVIKKMGSQEYHTILP